AAEDLPSSGSTACMTRDDAVAHTSTHIGSQNVLLRRRRMFPAGVRSLAPRVVCARSAIQNTRCYSLLAARGLLLAACCLLLAACYLQLATCWSDNYARRRSRNPISWRKRPMRVRAALM